ncbi:lyase family protein [Bailinhaonella thermotolerans]|uniref:3-carboxy-cis,cis-muconate cycloisomerase n=1 Tax=Bailinhaonella thermotolerans TaxID=1070861 RepID=A0A3A4AUR8_9ACTN|nr:lyase family protein [Bailinhaonella thermotolerans]RJL32451.1 3-carboxy-cis,cis-muconate cycloisomerase [Bailinhaonella thermotolerans]
MQTIFGAVFARGAAADLTGGAAWLRAMLDAEAALARAQAAAGIISAADADDVVAAVGSLGADPGLEPRLGTAAAGAGNPVVPLAAELRRLAPAAHHGATSQDILDTAAMLVSFRALGPLLDDLAAATGRCAALADEHRDTLMAGRTLLQQAVPVTFGLRAAGWLTALDAAAARLREVRARRLAVQYGGAAGTLAPLGDRGAEVVPLLAAELGLAAPPLPWHTDRTRIGELAGALGTAAGVLGKIALDVKLLAQTEVAEVAEPSGDGRGGSSAMPHKRNPVGAVAVAACAQRAPGLVATLLSAMVQEHERAAGAWHAEWEPLSDLLRVVGSAAAWARELLAGLRIDAARMRGNITDVHTGGADPGAYLGSAAAFIGNALASRQETV